MIHIDGSQGEGGGQILRSALALSLVTGEPFCIDKIRAGRAKPGLLRQHLTAVQAAVEIGRATAAGAAIGSSRLEFKPGQAQPGDYRFAIGSAGSATLVLQTVLPVLLTLSSPSTLTLRRRHTQSLRAALRFHRARVSAPARTLGTKCHGQARKTWFLPGGWRPLYRANRTLTNLDAPRSGRTRRGGVASCSRLGRESTPLNCRARTLRSWPQTRLAARMSARA